MRPRRERVLAHCLLLIDDLAGSSADLEQHPQLYEHREADLPAVQFSPVAVMRQHEDEV